MQKYIYTRRIIIGVYIYIKIPCSIKRGTGAVTLSCLHSYLVGSEGNVGAFEEHEHSNLSTQPENEYIYIYIYNL